MDKIRIIWSEFAIDNVEEIGVELESKSFSVAKNVVSSIFKRITQLESFPNSGAPEENLKGLNLGHRFLVVYSYEIIYRPIGKSTVYITDVFPCRMNPDELSTRAKNTNP